MPLAIAQDRTDPMEPHGAKAHRAYGSPAFATEGAASCDGCRIRSMSLCAALPEVGRTVVPPFRISEQRFSPGRDIVEQGEAGHEFCVIVGGWAVQHELVEDGGRQILDFLLPGSIAGFRPDGETLSPHFVQALTDVRACRFSKTDFLDAARSNPALALRLAEMANQSYYRSLRRLTLTGRRTAKERVAALFCELYRRVRRWSLPPREDEISLPLTQEHIGDALGLTNVHVNRMLRELREEGVLVLKRGVLRLLDPVRLAEIAGCDDHLFVPPSPDMSIPRKNRPGAIFDMD